MKKTTLISKVDSMLEGMIGRLEKMEKAAIDQFPEICKEIIAERKVEIENEIIINTLGGIVAAIIASILFYTGLNSTMELINTLLVILAMVITALSIASFGTALCYGLQLRELKVAPKLFVLNKLRKMLHIQ